MGVTIDQLNFPVCNGFKAKIVRDQLCYTLDPNNYKEKVDFNDKTKISLSFYIDYNEERQWKKKDFSDEHFITINTIGNDLGFKLLLNVFFSRTNKIVPGKSLLFQCYQRSNCKE